MKIAVPVVVFFVCTLTLPAADPQWLGRIEIPPTLTDRSGETGTMEGGIPANQWGAFGSGIAYLGAGNQYVVASDRGPADGATAFRCRFHIVEISVNDSPTVQVRDTKSTDPVTV